MSFLFPLLCPATVTNPGLYQHQKKHCWVPSTVKFFPNPWGPTRPGLKPGQFHWHGWMKADVGHPPFRYSASVVQVDFPNTGVSWVTWCSRGKGEFCPASHQKNECITDGCVLEDQWFCLYMKGFSQDQIWANVVLGSCGNDYTTCASFSGARKKKAQQIMRAVGYLEVKETDGCLLR